MSADQVATDHYRKRQRLSDAVSKVAERTWRQLDAADLDASWARLGPTLQVALAGAQLAAAGAADRYVTQSLGEQGTSAPADGQVRPGSLSGVASDGRPLDSLLVNSIFIVKAAIAGGTTLPMAMASGFANLDMIVRTQVADAGRVADQVAITARPKVAGYVRMLSPPSCSRCVVLAGKFYRYNAGFDRHPNCDCVHIPAAESGDVEVTNPRKYFDSLSRAEQDRAFTIAGAQAIRDGADISQIVNARRGGLSIAGGGQQARLERRDVFGHQLFTTTEGTTRQGVAGSRLGRAPRLMPESIYEIAGDDRAEAIRLLRRNGYIT